MRICIIRAYYAIYAIFCIDSPKISYRMTMGTSLDVYLPFLTYFKNWLIWTPFVHETRHRVVCRYRILGMQIWISSKHPTFKYDFCEKTQYSNMNFCGFSFTPGKDTYLIQTCDTIVVFENQLFFWFKQNRQHESSLKTLTMSKKNPWNGFNCLS